MNKNSKNRRRIAAKNFHKGNRETVFDICITMPNSSNLGWRKQTIAMGDIQRKSKFPKVARKTSYQTGISNPKSE